MAQPRANWTVPERRLPCRLGCYPIQPENYNKITKVSDIHQIGEEHCSWSSIFVSVSRLDDFFACHIWRGRVLFNWTKRRTEELWPIKRGRFLHEWAKQGCKKNWVKGQRIYRAQSKYYSWLKGGCREKKINTQPVEVYSSWSEWLALAIHKRRLEIVTKFVQVFCCVFLFGFKHDNIMATLWRVILTLHFCAFFLFKFSL